MNLPKSPKTLKGDGLVLVIMTAPGNFARRPRAKRLSLNMTMSKRQGIRHEHLTLLYYYTYYCHYYHYYYAILLPLIEPLHTPSLPKSPRALHQQYSCLFC